MPVYASDVGKRRIGWSKSDGSLCSEIPWRRNSRNGFTISQCVGRSTDPSLKRSCSFERYPARSCRQVSLVLSITCSRVPVPSGSAEAEMSSSSLRWLLVLWSSGLDAFPVCPAAAAADSLDASRVLLASSKSFTWFFVLELALYGIHSSEVCILHIKWSVAAS